MPATVNEHGAFRERCARHSDRAAVGPGKCLERVQHLVICSSERLILFAELCRVLGLLSLQTSN
jgi:hypothetical protein